MCLVTDGLSYRPCVTRHISFHVIVFNIIIFLLFMSHARAVFSDPGIVPLPSHRIDFSDSHSDGGSMAPKEDWTICTK